MKIILILFILFMTISTGFTSTTIDGTSNVAIELNSDVGVTVIYENNIVFNYVKPSAQYYSTLETKDLYVLKCIYSGIYSSMTNRQSLKGYSWLNSEKNKLLS